MKVCMGCGVEFEGAPQAKFHSEACRKAYARRANAGDIATAEVLALPSPVAAVEDVVDVVPLPALPVRELAISEEDYVAQELAITAAQIRRGLKDHDGKRMQRSEAYARWLYRGVKEGRVASL